jgi:hypothetical protein
VVLNTTTNNNPFGNHCFTAQLIRTWQATDCCGRTATCSQEVDVIDSAPPALTCAPGKTVFCDAAWTFDPPTVSTNCCPNPSVTILSTVTNGVCPQQITRTWQAVGCCGTAVFPNNTSTCSQTVTVTNNHVPQITCAPDKTVICGTPWTFDLPMASEPCCSNITFRVVADVVSSTAGNHCTTNYTRIWRAVDCCGRESVQCSQTVTVNAPPCDPLVIASISFGPGGVVNISFPTRPCLTYEVQYKDNLGIGTPWLPLTTVNGTGGVVIITDPPPHHGNRFYRVFCHCQ